MSGIITQGFGDGGSGSGSGSASGVVGATGYPSASDLSAFLVGAKLLTQDEADAIVFTDYASAAVAEFERRTGWFPFLSSGVEESRNFYPSETGLIDMNAGLLSLTSLTVSGTAYTNNQQFVLEPMTAPNQERPYTMIRWGGGGYRGYGFGCGVLTPIVITGKWGRCLTLPADVRQAILRLGAIASAPGLVAANSAGQIKSKQVGDVRLDFVPYSQQIALAQTAWQGIADRTIRDYQRMVLA